MTRIIPTEQPINYQLSLANVIFLTGRTIVGDITATTADIIQSEDGNEFLGLIAGDSAQYPPLPETGEWCESGKLYEWDNGVVSCRQSHARTIYPPEDTPALFSVYRVDGGETLEWIVGEQVQVGNIRSYEDPDNPDDERVDYRCIQAHQTQVDWPPPLTPTLWALVAGAGEWAAGVAYAVDDEVVYSGVEYKCLQGHTSQVGWEPLNVPALWEEIETGTFIISEWVQPTGAHDAYQIGDQVTYNGATWESDYDANIWQPGVFGWTEI